MFDEVTILTVDDDDFVQEMLGVMLSELDCRIIRAANGRQALELLESEPQIDLVLLDLEMPVMDGYDTLTRVKQSSLWRDIPVIVVTGEKENVTRTLALGANDFISKPYNPEELRLRAMNHVRSKKLSDLAKDMSRVLEEEVVRKTASLNKALELSKNAEYEISLRLGRAAEFRDQETGLHTRRISELSRELAFLAGVPDDQCNILLFASPLHDVGKIGIPDRILLKPGKLDETEFEIMKTHTSIGGTILSDSERYPVIEAGGIIAMQHHEKWNGSGYPSGLKGEEIHLFARIVSIVDVFDALSSDRPYKKAFSLETTIRIMEEGRGELFDPSLLTIFMRNVDDFVTIREKLRDVPEVLVQECDSEKKE
ncbi:MAG: response regulator [Desulfuromonadaceae bacterium]|nr:response regulator [Desulfuromonadaceae bacterium]